VDISEIAQKIVAKMRLIATQKEITIESVPVTPQYIFGNSAGLERVIFNLLRNSIEHTPPSGSIVVCVEQEGSQVIAKVSDTGTGIDAKDLPHIFDRFYKGEGEQGSGLGLAIVKTLVAQHHGSVEIQSTKGKGTVVSMKFPKLS
jgi:signal transduction histidine kinase